MPPIYLGDDLTIQYVYLGELQIPTIYFGETLIEP